MTMKKIVEGRNKFAAMARSPARSLWLTICLFLPLYDVHAARDLDIILYGATGCVGHFAAYHLANQTGLKWAMADRNATRLDDLAAELASMPSGKPEIIVSPLTGDLAWVSRAITVATAAGPFSIHDGENLVRACAIHGVHYADTSDEFYWQRRMIDRYDARAASSGAHIALASGFCAIAADVGTQLALDAVAISSTAPAHIDAWLERYSGGVSAGVIHTVHVNASYPKEWDTDPYVLAPDAPASLRVDSLVDGMHYPAIVKDEGVVVANLFGDYEWARAETRTGIATALMAEPTVGAALFRTEPADCLCASAAPTEAPRLPC